MNGLFAVSPGYVVTITPNTAAIPGAFSAFSVIEQKAPRLSASGADVLIGAISWTAAACILPGGVLVPGAGSITATAAKVTTDGAKPLRVNDSGMCTGSFTTQAGPVPCSCSLKISAAGQNKAGGM